jgi:hypothetical protein
MASEGLRKARAAALSCSWTRTAMKSIASTLYALARLFAWGSAFSRGPRAVGKRARNRVVMRGAGRCSGNENRRLTLLLLNLLSSS